MKTEMVMPQMGESIAEATILKWLKGVGDKVEKDETILEISTDKVDSEIPAPESGVIVELRANEGDTVAVKEIIAVIDSDQAAAAEAIKNGGSNASSSNGASAAPKETPKKAAEPAPAAKPTPPPPAQPAAPAAPPAMPASAGTSVSETPSHYGHKFFSPLVRSLATQHGVSTTELASVPGTGANGRITKDDFMNYLQHRGAAPAAGASQPAHAPQANVPAPPSIAWDENGTRVEEMDKMRKLIAEHMVRSKATSPHVYSTAECDVTNISKWRKANQSAFQARTGFKLSFTPFFLEAAVKGLMQFPYINASIDGDKIVLKKDINLGCAVALGNTGLIVPVIKNAEQLSLVGLAEHLTDIATRARSKQLKPDDIAGGTFTVTNPGVFGNIIGNPIINQPQLAILSIGAIKKRPMVVNDMIAIREMVYLTLSYDHRLVDGSLGGQYLKYVTSYLENWDVNKPLF